MAMGKTRRNYGCVVIIALLGLFGIPLIRVQNSFVIKSAGVVNLQQQMVPQKQANVNPKGPYDAMVLTYMRSGSTFVGKVLGFREDTFYWYEPLWKLHRTVYLSDEGIWCNYKTPGCKNGTAKTSNTTRTTLQFLLDIYKCENLYQHYNRYSVLQRKPSFSGSSGKVYEECMKRKLSSNCQKCILSKTKNAPECESPKCLIPRQEVECFRKTMDRCAELKHRVTKVLRMSATHAQYLLENHERLKIVHVFRDPRAVINSRVKTKWYYQGNISSPELDAPILCERMMQDMATAEYLRTLYPDRVKIIQYEDFYDPHRLAVDLYNFFNMDMTLEAEQLIRTLAGTNPVTDRRSFHPDSYRSTMQWKAIESINNVCLQVIEKLGLRVFNSAQELLDFNLSTVLDTLPYGIESSTKQ